MKTSRRSFLSAIVATLAVPVDAVVTKQPERLQRERAFYRPFWIAETVDLSAGWTGSVPLFPGPLPSRFLVHGFGAEGDVFRSLLHFQIDKTLGGVVLDMPLSVLEYFKAPGLGTLAPPSVVPFEPAFIFLADSGFRCSLYSFEPLPRDVSLAVGLKGLVQVFGCE